MKKAPYAAKLKKNDRLMLIGVLIAMLLSVFMLYSNMKANQNDADVNVLSIMRANAGRLSDIVEQYQAESFSQSTVIWTMPFYETASEIEISRQLQRPGDFVNGARSVPTNPFTHNTTMYSMVAQIRGLVQSNQNIDMLLFYAPFSGIVLGVMDNGASVLYSNHAAEVPDMLPLSEGQWNRLLHERTMVFAPAGEDGRSGSLFFSVVSENGVTCICHFDEKTLGQTILNVNYGPVYSPFAFMLTGDFGTFVSADSQNRTEELTEGDWSLRPAIEQRKIDGKKLTVMNVSIPKLDSVRFIAAFEKIQRLKLNGNSLRFFTIICAVWVATFVCLVILIVKTYKRPLQDMVELLPAETMESPSQDEIAALGKGIRYMSHEMESAQQMIHLQSEALRRELIRESLFGGVRSFEMEKRAGQLWMERYRVAVLSPFQWERTQPEESELEQLLRSGFPDADIEPLINREQLVLIDHRPDGTSLKTVAEWLGRMSVRRPSFYESPVYEGVNNLNKAYFHALVDGPKDGIGLLNGTSHKAAQSPDLLSLEMSVLSALDNRDYRKASGIFDDCLEKIFAEPIPATDRNLYLTGLFGTLVYHFSLHGLLNGEEQAELICRLNSPEMNDLETLRRAWNRIFDKIGEKWSEEHIHSALFEKIDQYMRDHYADPALSLIRLSDEINVSVASITREFKKNTGKGFLDNLHALRVDAAKQLLSETELSLKEIANAVGYESTLTMTRAFKRIEMTTPGAYRNAVRDPGK